MLASIALPRNTFFNTAQLTYILAIEKRHATIDPRPPVFCGIARSIGESLNWERIPTPQENDLLDIARMFVSHVDGNEKATDGSKIAKIVNAEEFSENDRWDVARFWSEDELVYLGQKESAVSRVDFIDEVQIELDEISAELTAARSELLELMGTGEVKEINLSDEAYFVVRSGTRVTGKEIREHPGVLPVYSCFKTDREVKGFVNENYFVTEKGGVVESKPIVTVNANGASVGKVYVRRDRCALTDDVIIVEVQHSGIDIDYMAVALRAAVDRGGFLYEAKLFTTRVRGLTVAIPVASDGGFDVEAQHARASAVKRFDALRTRLHDLGVRSGGIHAV